MKDRDKNRETETEKRSQEVGEKGNEMHWFGVRFQEVGEKGKCRCTGVEWYLRR